MMTTGNGLIAIIIIFFFDSILTKPNKTKQNSLEHFDD